MARMPTSLGRAGSSIWSVMAIVKRVGGGGGSGGGGGCGGEDGGDGGGGWTKTGGWGLYTILLGRKRTLVRFRGFVVFSRAVIIRFSCQKGCICSTATDPFSPVSTQRQPKSTKKN
ncbi:hypothetical protein BOTBODRAFT_440937 [Botryobasidium botryosum FD-172 SS1]|uniref:Uncharacterized protein n=1 Tax=Botryobasidium botryosum (strain FD-172 SS1) TaxID=930990 RepID=A0A067MV75_BOTB1|nr:hypothetical protein BOTBODRAFT_440937 [Botryobasidium botryosum FD-172 SS1]